MNDYLDKLINNIENNLTDNLESDKKQGIIWDYKLSRIKDNLIVKVEDIKNEKHEYSINISNQNSIKNGFVCNGCGQISSAEDIDNATNDYFGGGCISILSDKDDCDYLCPKCNEIIGGQDFRLVE